MSKAYTVNLKKVAVADTQHIWCETPVKLHNMKFRSSTKVGAFSYMLGGDITRLKQVGRYCSIAVGFSSGPASHPKSWLSTSPFQFAPIKVGIEEGFSFVPTERSGKNDHSLNVPSPVIGNDVWIGMNVQLMNGVTVGDGAIVAAEAVVTKNVMPYHVVAGIPAKTIGMRFPEKLSERLLKSRWWQYDALDLSGMPFDSPVEALDALDQRVDAGLQPRTVSYALEITGRGAVRNRFP